MRRMWLWVLLYAIVLGLVLLFMGVGALLGLALFSPGSAALNALLSPGSSPLAIVIGVAAGGIGVLATMVGFLALIAGMIFLLIRRTVAVGRVVSLIGIGLYHLAALGIVLAASMIMSTGGSSPWNIVVFTLLAILAAAVIVFLPAFFMTRTLMRAQKAEKSET
jgi:hypothetical protein